MNRVLREIVLAVLLGLGIRLPTHPPLAKSDEFQYDVFLSASSKDKAVVRPLAEQLRKDGVKVWLDEWVVPVASVYDRPGERERSQSAATAAKIEEGLEHSRVLVLCMSANAFASDCAQLACPAVASERRRKASTFRFRDPLNKERRFIPLRLDGAPMKGLPGAIPLHQLASCRTGT